MELTTNSIIFAGGGSAGHVIPNLALAEKLRANGWKIYYLGSHDGIERDLVTNKNIPYYPIDGGKLRRYFSLKNFIDPFKVIIGIVQAYKLCRELKPKIIFAKGGFVAVPVVIAGWLNRIPVILHESDLTPGLANKLCFPFAKKICITFSETKNYFSNQTKVIETGAILRPEILRGNAEKGLQFCHFEPNRKVLLIIGGGLGAASINQTIRAALPDLLKFFQIIHICGKDKIDPSFKDQAYRQFEYVQDELPNLLACANIVVSRAGANSIYELLSLHKPHILIPLPAKASRGDQIANAKYFVEHGYSIAIPEETLTPKSLIQRISWILQNEQAIVEKLKFFKTPDGVSEIYDIIVAESV